MEAEGERKGVCKKRVRTKGLQKKLLQQVEFYFGEANLQKDRFLQQKMKEHPDGYVSVETIASFNKMKSLTTDMKMVVQVMKSSSLLELTDDDKWVRRSKPLALATDTDERTIYVEHLPSHYDQDSVRKLFKVFGSITYVSLPRHKLSGTIKGFSFVEFSTVEEANAALEYFKSGAKPASLIGSQKPEPGGSRNEHASSTTELHLAMEGQTVVEGGERGEESGGLESSKHEEELGEDKGRKASELKDTELKEGEETQVMEEQKEEEGLQETTRTGDLRAGREEAETCDKDTVYRKRKRDLDTADETEEVEVFSPHSKKSKSGDSIVQPADETGKKNEDREVEKAKELTHTSTEGGVTSEQSVGVEKEHQGFVMMAESRKRKRQDESGDREEEDEKKGMEEYPEVDESDLGRVRKLERLDSQATEDTTGEDVAEGKKGRRRNRQHKKWDWQAAIRGLQLRVMSKKEWLDMRGIFRDMQKERVREMKQKLKEGGERPQKGGYVGKCLVKVEGVGKGEGEDIITVNAVKEICSKYGPVAYVDIKDGESEGFVRYAEPGCVEKLVNAEHLTHIKFSAVSDADERAYYLKTVAARKQIRKGKKKQNIRGQDKIISRALQHQDHTRTEHNKPASPVGAATHIRFSDSEHES